MKTTILGIATACTLGLTVALATAAPAQAQAGSPGRYAAPGDQFYVEPQQAPQQLRFANLEAAMPRDPSTWSSDPGWQLHRTPASQLADASNTLRAVIPAGTTATEAAALLHKAGARCATGNNSQLVCSYRGAETPYGGVYFDNVKWRVWLDVADGRVSNLAVTRDWTRH